MVRCSDKKGSHMFKPAMIALSLLTSVLFASLAFATDPPDPVTGENVIPAGGLGVVVVLLPTTSGTWSDFASDDGGALDLVLVSDNGTSVHAGGQIGCGPLQPGDRILFLYSNTTGSPIDVTVTMNFTSGGYACPPL